MRSYLILYFLSLLYQLAESWEIKALFRNSTWVRVGDKIGRVALPIESVAACGGDVGATGAPDSSSSWKIIEQLHAHCNESAAGEGLDWDMDISTAGGATLNARDLDCMESEFWEFAPKACQNLAAGEQGLNVGLAIFMSVIFIGFFLILFSLGAWSCFQRVYRGIEATPEETETVLDDAHVVDIGYGSLQDHAEEDSNPQAYINDKRLEEIVAKRKDPKKLKIAKEFICPITRAIMTVPVVASDGYTYEESAIKAWVQEHGTSPMTREPLSIGRLNPNHAIKNLINDFLDNMEKEIEQNTSEESAVPSGISSVGSPAFSRLSRSG